MGPRGPWIITLPVGRACVDALFTVDMWLGVLVESMPMQMAATIAAAAALMLAGRASYPGGRTEHGNCVPLYGGTLVTLPKPGYRFADGSFIPTDQIVVMKDGGLWKCGGN